MIHYTLVGTLKQALYRKKDKKKPQPFLVGVQIPSGEKCIRVVGNQGRESQLPTNCPERQC
jgi:hypothetical protein